MGGAAMETKNLDFDRIERAAKTRKTALSIVIYTLLARFQGTQTKVGFIHIPYSKEQGKEPSMELCDMIKALTVAIERLDVE